MQVRSLKCQNQVYMYLLISSSPHDQHVTVTDRMWKSKRTVSDEHSQETTPLSTVSVDFCMMKNHEAWLQLCRTSVHLTRHLTDPPAVVGPSAMILIMNNVGSAMCWSGTVYSEQLEPGPSGFLSSHWRPGIAQWLSRAFVHRLSRDCLT